MKAHGFRRELFTLERNSSSGTQAVAERIPASSTSSPPKSG